MWPLLWVGLAAASDCDATLTELQATLDRAETSWRDLDVDGFPEAMRRAHEQLACLVDRMPPDTAARLHLLEGIRRFAAGHEDAAAASFRAVRVLDPDLALDPGLVPPNHPIANRFQAQPTRPGVRTVPPPPVDGELVFDGAGPEQPAVHATVAQYVGDDGWVRWTAYVDPGAGLPSYPAGTATSSGRFADDAVLLTASLARMAGAADRRTTVLVHEDGAWFRDGPVTGGALGLHLGAQVPVHPWVDLGGALLVASGSRHVRVYDGEDDVSGTPDDRDGVWWSVTPRVVVHSPREHGASLFAAAGLELRPVAGYSTAHVEVPGGILPGVQGALGITYPVTTRVGYHLEAAATGYTGALGGTQEVGPTPPSPPPALGDDGRWLVDFLGGVVVGF